MIIRLIDIVLIVLFGFITISDIDIKAGLSLPAKKKKKVTMMVEKRPKIPVYVEVDKGEIFWVFTTSKNRVRQKGIRALEDYVKKIQVQTLRKENKNIAVIIKPNEMSPIQSTIDVLDMCDRNEIPKNIARKSLALF